MYLEIIKRLEIIKSAVAIEEEELIEMQLEKLKGFELDDRVLEIVTLIESRRFETVPGLIEQYKQDQSGLAVYEDEAVQGLKYELKILENTLNGLTNEKNEYERLLHEFNAEYILRLGALIEKILCLRYRHYAEMVDVYPEFAEEAEEAQKAYESFRQNNEEQLQDLPNTLTEDEKKELKELYRKASRLSHPDVVSDEFKQQGEEVFKSLNEAYRQQNLTRVREILLHLETGQSFGIASDSVSDKEILRKKIGILRQHLEQLEEEIKLIKEDETFKTLQKIKDREAYFAGLEQKLTEELASLQKN